MPVRVNSTSASSMPPNARVVASSMAAAASPASLATSAKPRITPSRQRLEVRRSAARASASMPP